MPLDNKLGLKKWSLYEDPEETENNEILDLRRARETAFENIQEKAHSTLTKFKSKRILQDIQEGQYIMLYNAPLQAIKKALWLPWQGPYVVVKKQSYNVYTIVLLSDLKIRKTVNIDKLRVCFPKIEEIVKIPIDKEIDIVDVGDTSTVNSAN